MPVVSMPLQASRFQTAAPSRIRLHDGAPPTVPPRAPLLQLGGEGGGAIDTAALTVGRVDWPYLLGGYAGAMAVGGLVGYVAQGDRRGALTGGLTAGAVWSAAETVHQWRAVHWGVGTAFLAWSLGGFYLALRRKPKGR